jgi:hypothetical protein
MTVAMAATLSKQAFLDPKASMTLPMMKPDVAYPTPKNMNAYRHLERYS